MASKETGRVVVRRKRGYGEAHHGGSWKIAYADFMTAMMAFFLVMWLVLLIPKDDLPAIAEYFRQPLATAISGGPKLDNSKSVIPGGDPSPVPNAFPSPPSTPSLNDQSNNTGDLHDLENLENLKLELKNLIEHNPVLQQFRPQLLLDMTPDGLRIQILDQENRPMFNLGSAIVQSYMRDILRELAPLVNQLPNSITVSGHTDATQYASGDRNYSNWELSADRANSARRELVAGGLGEKKIKRILGLADTVDLIPDKPLAEVNRRISILVLNRSAERRIDEQNAAGNSAERIQQHMENLEREGALQNNNLPSFTGNSPSSSPNNQQKQQNNAAPADTGATIIDNIQSGTSDTDTNVPDNMPDIQGLGVLPEPIEQPATNQD